MLSRVSLRGFRNLKCSTNTLSNSVRSLTTKTTITDHSTGKVIKLTDPNHPEMGDYPNPPPVLAQMKDPYAKYDDQQNRRNIGDPLNFNDDLYDMWSPDYFDFVSDRTALKHNAIFFSLIVGFGISIWYFELNPAKPASPRSYPSDGLAKELGSGDEKDNSFYRVKPDVNAEKELKVLPGDKDVSTNVESYIKANSDYINA